MWSWQHPPLLLQMTSTSPVKLYHAILKMNGDASFSLIGACKISHKADRSYFDQAKRVELDFWTKSISEAMIYPYLVGFPNPVQHLILGKICAFEKRLEDGKLMPSHDIPECNYQFFRWYMLPCRHLFHRNIHNDFLTNSHWLAF